jgi:hypothetical protein
MEYEKVLGIPVPSGYNPGKIFRAQQESAVSGEGRLA